MSVRARFLLLALLPSCAGRSSREAFAPEGAVSRVEIHVDAGDLRIRGGSELRVERTFRGLQAARVATHRLVDGVLTLEAHCAPLLPCATDMDLVVPPGVPVAATLGSGEVHVTGASSLTLALGAGRADLAVAGPVNASVGVGEVQIRPAVGALSRVSVADGDVHAEVVEDGWTVSAAASEVSLSGVHEGEGGASQLELLAPGGRAVVTRIPSVAGR